MLRDEGLTTAAATAAVCAAMAVPFLAFWKPSVPQDVRDSGWLSKPTTWMCVLQGGREEQSFILQFLTLLAQLTAGLVCPFRSIPLQRPPSSDLLSTSQTRAEPF